MLVNARTKKLLDEVLELRDEDKAFIAERLEESLMPMPEDAANAWAKEAERRVCQVEEGRAETIPATEVHQKLREKLGMPR